MIDHSKIKENVEILLSPRFIVLVDFHQRLESGMPPSMHRVKGQIIDALLGPGTASIWHEQTVAYFKEWPDVFRPLEWYEYRTVDELSCVKFVTIREHNKPGYYLPGDQVPVTDYIIKTTLKDGPVLTHYNVGPGRNVEPKFVYPATKKEL